MAFPLRLTMIRENVCRVCGDNSPCVALRLEILFGWYFCIQCVGTVYESALNYMDTTIPLHGVLTQDTYINFLRSTGQLWKGYIDLSTFNLTRADNGEYMASIVFNITDPELKLTNAYKNIALHDMYDHNPNVYYHIYTCNNLFGNDTVQIGYKQLSADIKSRLHYERPYIIKEILKNWHRLIDDINKYIYEYLFDVHLRALIYDK